MGLYSSPLQRIGMLSADAWRAARLVVDTGLHAFGWTRQQAVDYMAANTPVAPIDIEAEILRKCEKNKSRPYKHGKIC